MRNVHAVILSTVLVITLGSSLQAATTMAPGTKPNVLFIAFDDLGDWIQLLDPASPIATPNLDRLAARGVLFRRAYCAAPECNPSRTSLLSGYHPTTSGIYENASDWRAVMPDVVMLPRYFRQHGYHTAGAGKLFHHVHAHFHDDASFDEHLPFERPILPAAKLNKLTRAQTPAGEWEPLAPTFDWGESPVPESQIGDVRYAGFAVDFLKRPQEKPFFLSVGFFLPHLPHFSPARSLEHYDSRTIRMPDVKAGDLDDVPAGGHALLHRWLRMFRGIQQHPDFEGKWREAVAAYAAAVTFADEQLGRVLDALDQSPHRDNTLIVVWSDHGYHLGEKGHWTKFVLWEKSTRVPLVIVAPGVAGKGGVSDRPVSLLDLYPTLVELCDLPPRRDLDGQSLVPLLRDPQAPREVPVLTTEMRGNHAVRTDRWRYIRYADGGEELYDHSTDPHEWHNLAADPQNAEVLAAHRQWLPFVEAAAAPNMTRQTDSVTLPKE